MHRTAGGLLVLLLALPAGKAADDPKDKPATPAEQYQTLVKEFEKAQQDFFKAFSEAPDEERPKLRREKYPDFGPKFLELAEKNAKDPVALDALVWVATNNYSTTTDRSNSLPKALDLLLKDHLQSNKLAGVCERLALSTGADAPTAFLLAVLEKSQHKDVQAEACLALAERALLRVRMIEGMKKEPDSVDQLTQAYGKPFVDGLKKDDAVKLTGEGDKYFRQFTEGFSAELPAKRLTRLCSRMAYSTDKASEALLRSLLEKDTRPEVQGAAGLFLAKVLWRRAEDLPEADAKDAARLLKESEDLLERVAAKYPEVELEYRSTTVGKMAQKELFGLRNLTVGKVAPEIEAADQDGKKFKLSDYRGKVVLLDFWSQH